MMEASGGSRAIWEVNQRDQNPPIRLEIEGCMPKTWASERDGDGPAGSSPHMIEATGPAEAVGPGGEAGSHSKHLTNLW